MNQANPDLARLSAELTVACGRLVRAVTARSGNDVPAAQLRLLSQLDELGPVSIGQLALHDRCSQPTMSNLVNKLAASGWASKAPHPTDARSSLVTITDAGRTVLSGARRRNAAVVARRLEADPNHDIADLAAAVSLLNGLLAGNPTQTETTERVA